MLISVDNKIKDKQVTKSSILKRTKRSKETISRGILKQLGSRTKNQKSMKTIGRSAAGDLPSTSSLETTAILSAMADLKAGIDSKMDQIDKSNKESIRMVREEIGSIRKEFNLRIEGLARKMEDRVRKMFEKDIQVAVEKVAAKNKAKLENR